MLRVKRDPYMLTVTLKFTSLLARPIRACDIDIVAMFSKMRPYVSRQSLCVDVLRTRVVSGRVARDRGRTIWRGGSHVRRINLTPLNHQRPTETRRNLSCTG